MAWIRSVLACLITALMVGSFAAPGIAAGDGCSGVDVGQEWTTIEGPEFEAGPRSITDHALAPRKPDRIWVTNGISVVLTDDGGCSWEDVFSLSELPELDMPVSQLTGKILSLSVPEAANAQDQIYMMVSETIGPASRPHVIASYDAGRTWELRDQGLPPASGALIEMNVAPSNAKTIYVLMQGTPVTTPEVWVTQNAGESWQKQGEIPGANGFSIDPLNASELWLRGASLQYSSDGGRSYAKIEYVGPPVGPIDVFHASGAPSRVLAYQIEGGMFSRTMDGGKTWSSIPTPPNRPLSVAHGNTQDDIIMSVHEGIYRFREPYYWVEVTPGVAQTLKLPEDYEDIVDFQMPRVDAPAPVGRTSTTLERYTGFAIALPPLAPAAAPVKTDALLAGPKRPVRIEAGASKDVDYRLELPPQPTPLDVLFLVDTTESMESSINGLLAGLQRISRDLSDADVDVRFGAGEYKDYPIAGFGDPLAGDFPYRRNRDMGPADASLVAALEMMEASGGGRHAPESQLTALYQAATGEGEPGCTDPAPDGPSSGPGAARGCVPPGQGLSFRGDALRVIVNITDAGFENSAAHPSPPFDTVSAELARLGIMQVGLAVYGPNGNKPALASLGEMASETGALVPEGGVDCDGDGTKELPAGAPLVCEILDETQHGVANLAPAILASLRALTDIADVGLVARSGGSLIEEISPSFSGVDVKDAQTLDFTVTYACPEDIRTRASVDLVGTVRDASVAGTTTKVVCKPVAEDEADEPIAAIVAAIEPPLAALVAVPPAPPPPAPVTQYQAQPNANVQAAAAQQEQEETQVATVHQLTEEDLEESYAMTAYERRPRGVDAEAFALYLAAVGMAGVAAAVRLRTRHRVATQRAGRGVR